MSNSQDYFSKYWADLHRLSKNADTAQLAQCAALMEDVNAKGSKIIVVGNGGSAGIASHVAIDLTKAAGLRATCFNEAGLLTCFGNDFGYENWVQKALEFYADPDDVIILISSSGQSANMVNAATYAQDKGLALITLTGFKPDNPLRGFGDFRLWVDSTHYNYVETIHQNWLLAMIDFLIDKKRVKIK